MKNKLSKLFFLFGIFACSIVLTTCKKLEKVMLVSTGEVTNVLNRTADAAGQVIDLGNGAIQYGHCWAKTANVTISEPTKTQLGVPTGTTGFTSQLTDLEAGTKYYIKAYLSDGTVTVYGKEINFTTVAVSAPALTTTAITSISATGAASGGNITSDGGANVTARGVCWGIATAPTIASSKSSDGTGTGTFISSIIGLSAGTLYYVRAYATNNVGTAYGNELTFTSGYLLPTLTTTAITAVTSTSASSGGNITSNGGASVTDRGVCWNTVTGPTVANNKTSDGSGSGVFVSSIAGLTPGTTYFVRAYATNAAGTAYGNEVTLTATALLPTLATTAITSITSTTASSGGNITNDGGASVTVRGVCWGTTTNPTITGNKTSNGSGTGSFVSSITSLTPGSTYYVRAYATNSAGTAYGNELSFAASAVLPTLTTTAASSIAATTATSGGNITNEGGASITARGVCWSTIANPSLTDNSTTNGTGSGSFVSSLTGLTSNTTYYTRAYATNSVGTAYGTQVSFTTSISLPVLATDIISSITSTTATSGGNVTSEGGASVTARGVCWATATTPTISNSKTVDGSGTGAFTSSLTGLVHGTTYYVRAYATNSGGTAYGNEISFAAAVELPILSTTAITNITSTSATCGGNISGDGGSAVISRGICWSLSTGPTTNDSKTTDGSGLGSFISNLSGLTLNTTYYVRSYATNAGGTAYGNEITFVTYNWVLGNVSDIDGNVYKTILIGPQVWMQENLKVTHYNNGDEVPEVYDGTAWIGLSTGAYCYYNNDAANVVTYGRLYNWYAATDTRSLCPSGWHLPTDSEWTTLSTFLGGTTIASGKLKEVGLGHWASPNTGATNLSGFTALPGGKRNYTSGSFNYLGTSGYWWETDGQYQYMDNDNAVISKSNTSSSAKKSGSSVRCVKN